MRGVAPCKGAPAHHLVTSSLVHWGLTVTAFAQRGPCLRLPSPAQLGNPTAPVVASKAPLVSCCSFCAEPRR